MGEIFKKNFNAELDMETITNPHRQKQLEEFLDREHPVMSRYYELLNRKISPKQLKGEMALLIKKDLDFYDPYLVLGDILTSEGKKKEANVFLAEAYERAVKRIVDKQGNFPKRLIWGWLDNRHLMRVIERWGLMLWEQGKAPEALIIFRKLLQSNPGDNQGVRFTILAISLGLNPDYENRFSSKDMPGYVDGFKISAWFDQYSKKFPDEFGWWFKAMKKGDY